MWHSLELLFEKRLGGKLFRPVGLDWFPDFWRLATPYGDDPRTVSQYLSLKGNDPLPEGYYYYDKLKGLTLEQFKEMPIDIVIASVPEQLPVYARLIREFKPQAKLVFQVGNHFGDTDYSLAKNIMASTTMVNVPKDINIVFYHQEFDLDIFKQATKEPEDYIRSFIHCLSQGEGQGNLFRDDWMVFKELEKGLPEYKFQAFGASCRDGCISRQEEIAEMMRESKFIFNLKTGGDGFGHVIFSCFAVGRPPIVKTSQYWGKLAGELMVDGETCVDMDGLSYQQMVEKIREFAKPEKYATLCLNARKKFDSIVNFDKEELQIRDFLSKLI